MSVEFVYDVAMLPDSIIELFDMSGSDEFSTPGTTTYELAGLAHSIIHQGALLRIATAKFARMHNLNLIDFLILLSVMTNTSQDMTVTPGYIAENQSLSASTLTSILERLAARGLLVRDQDAADKRRIALYYTEGAAKIVEAYYRTMSQALAPILDTNEATLSAFVQAFDTTSQALEAHVKRTA